MKYDHYIVPFCDSIVNNLLRIRETLGDCWTESMAEYAIQKTRMFPSVAWRVPRGRARTFYL